MTRKRHLPQKDAQIVESFAISPTPLDPQIVPPIVIRHHHPTRRNGTEEANEGRKRKAVPESSQRQTRSQTKLKIRRLGLTGATNSEVNWKIVSGVPFTSKVTKCQPPKSRPGKPRISGSVQPNPLERTSILEPTASLKVDSRPLPVDARPQKKKRREIPQPEDLKTFMRSAL